MELHTLSGALGSVPETTCSLADPNSSLTRDSFVGIVLTAWGA